MSSISVVLEALDRGVESLAALDVESLPVRQRLEALDQLETVVRRLRSSSSAMAGSLDRKDYVGPPTEWAPRGSPVDGSRFVETATIS